MSSIEIHSPQLRDISRVKTFASHIHLKFNVDLKKYFTEKFPGYYIFKIPQYLVDKVYFDWFFKSQEYQEALEKKLFSPKWEQYIKNKKFEDFYILDAHDYNGQIWKYLSLSQKEIEIEYYGDLFWVQHDIGHVFLDHLYTHGTFMHRDEMDASLYACLKLLFENKFQETEVKKLIISAAKDCLKTWKIINHEDIKYLFTFIDLFHKTLR